MKIKINFDMSVQQVTVESPAQASRVLRSFIDNGAYGASDMGAGCGDVVNAEGDTVFHVSYNGRVWTPDLQHEIAL